METAGTEQLLREFPEIFTLEPKDYAVLRGVDDGFCPAPESSIAIVASAGERIVGRIFLVSPTHIEGPWIDPDWRSSTLGKRLMDKAQAEAQEAGITKLLAFGMKHTEGYLGRLGFRRMALTIWEKDI